MIEINEEHTIVWITKYALTSGTFMAYGDVPHHITSRMVYANGKYYHGDQWHRSREAAEAQVLKMRDAKIKNIQKQLDTLLAIKPDLSGLSV